MQGTDKFYSHDENFAGGGVGVGWFLRLNKAIIMRNFQHKDTSFKPSNGLSQNST